MGIPTVGGCSCEPSPCHIPVTNAVPVSPACLFRYNVLSLVYLLFLLFLPWFPGPSSRVAAGKGSPGAAGVARVGWAAGGLPPPPAGTFAVVSALLGSVAPCGASLSVNYSPAGLFIALLLQNGHFGASLPKKPHHERPPRPARDTVVTAGCHPHWDRWARGTLVPPLCQAWTPLTAKSFTL